MLVTLDFETYYDSKLSLTKMTTMDYVNHDNFKVWGVGIKIDDEPAEWYGEEEARSALQEIDWSDATLLCHNTPFDGYILTQHYGLIPSYYLDTAAIGRALYPYQSARLKDIAIRLWPDDDRMRKGEELADAKGHFDLSEELEQKIAGYYIQDVELTWAIYKNLTKRMPLDELDIIDLTCRMFCEPKLFVDVPALKKYRNSEARRSKETIEASGILRAVLASNKQFSELLESMGITVPTKVSPTTGKNIPALGKNDKAFLQLQKMYPQHNKIWEARTAVKSRINETRAQRFIDAAHDDGTISVPLKYYAAHTGRFGGTEKINMQNMPRNSPIREALCAPDGKLIFVADLSNIEARMLAWLAGQEDLLQQFRDGEDIYSNFASKIYGKPINKKDHPTERFVGKTAILGLGYGMGATKFKNTLNMGIEQSEAVSIISTYRSTYFHIPTLWQRLEHKLASTILPATYEEWGCLTFTDRSIVLPNTLALKYPDLRFYKGGLIYDGRNSIENTWGGKITENVVQALSRLVVTDALLRIEKDQNLDVTPVLTVHDEIVLIGPKEEPCATMDKLIAHMCVPPTWAPDLPLDAEGGYDNRYSK